MGAETETFWGEEPREDSEREFLDQLQTDLRQRGVAAIILANFFTSSSSRQVDFLVVTDQHVCHVELKSYSGVLAGGINGSWSVRGQDGSVRPIDRQNPYTQAVGCKMAISDDMHALSAADASVPRRPGAKFYTTFDSVICIFPRLEDQSQVPSDYKAKTMGYADFLTFVTSPGPHPRWRREHWLALVQRLGLIPSTTSDQHLAVAQVNGLIADYTGRFQNHYQRGLHTLVPLPFQLPNQIGSLPEIRSALDSARHLQLVGPSGCGKSHVARHLAVSVTLDGLVPIFVEAGMYEGRLSAVLNRSVARFSTTTAERMLQAAALADRRVLLIIDGYNECPAQLQERLNGDLSAICLRHEAMTIVTSQWEVSLPFAPDSPVVGALPLTEADRIAVLDAHGTRDVLPLCEAFVTAYELSIAAQCAAELQLSLTRADLFAAYIRKRISDSPSPALVRQALRRLAVEMDERLTKWLPLDEAWRLVEQSLAGHARTADAVDVVLNSAITRAEQGRFSFSHELLGRFLTAENLAIHYAEPAALAIELQKPRHADLTQHVVELEHNPSRLKALLASIADSHVYELSLVGKLGQTARRIMDEAATRLLADYTESLAQTTFALLAEYKVQVTGGWDLSLSDRDLFEAIGSAVSQGHYLLESAALLQATDEACRRSADMQAGVERRRPVPSNIVAAVFVGLGNARKQLAAPILLEACRNSLSDSRLSLYDHVPDVVSDDLSTLAQEVRPQSFGNLLLLCQLLWRIDGLTSAALVPRVLQTSLASDAYHVQLEGLKMAQMFARATEDHPIRDQIVEILNGFNTDNIFLSTALLETLSAYGEIEPPGDKENIKAEILEVLEQADMPQRNELAYGMVASQFEDVVGEPYFLAIEELTPEQRVDLYTVAALDPTPHNFWADLLLRELLKSGSPRALPAFEYWATHLQTDRFFDHQTGTCYAVALVGCAQFLDSPPALSTRGTPEEGAWEVVGSVIFWMHKPDLDRASLFVRCEELWRSLRGDLRLPAVRALYRLSP